MSNRKQSVYLPTGLFHTSIETTPHCPGQLGKIVYDPITEAHYQYVKCSSTAAHLLTPTVAATILALWKDSKAFEVCTLLSQSEGGRNAVAGVFMGVPTAGQYCWIQKTGKAFVISDNSTAVGDVVTCKSSSTAGDCIHTTAGTAPVAIPVGVVVNVTASPTVTWAGAARTPSANLPQVDLCLLGD